MCTIDITTGNWRNRLLGPGLSAIRLRTTTSDAHTCRVTTSLIGDYSVLSNPPAYWDPGSRPLDLEQRPVTHTHAGSRPH
ncbi:hypothetical protein J6590_060616 [Homalodisca vitripennis]|nr:hypothetical protein J6590_060616 [Homalodisca vitripennis]